MILETFVRCFVNSDGLDRTVDFYKALLGGEESLRFDYPETGLQIASVSSPHLSVLVIAGAADKRKPFEATRITIKVTCLEDYAALLRTQGAELLDPIQKTPVGRKMRYRHADGLIVEYVQHDG
jgi:predicted enzyme related to lactoylglutathione lyase